MGFEVVEVPELPPPGQFVHVAKKDKFVFISGQTANRAAESGNLDPNAQAEEVFRYLKSAIEAAAMLLRIDDIVSGQKSSATKKEEAKAFAKEGNPYDALEGEGDQV